MNVNTSGQLNSFADVDEARIKWEDIRSTKRNALLSRIEQIKAILSTKGQ